jgi:hypothetical protein
MFGHGRPSLPPLFCAQFPFGLNHLTLFWNIVFPSSLRESLNGVSM